MWCTTSTNTWSLGVRSRIGRTTSSARSNRSCTARATASSTSSEPIPRTLTPSRMGSGASTRCQTRSPSLPYRVRRISWRSTTSSQARSRAATSRLRPRRTAAGTTYPEDPSADSSASHIRSCEGEHAICLVRGTGTGAGVALVDLRSSSRATTSPMRGDARTSAITRQSPVRDCTSATIRATSSE